MKPRVCVVCGALGTTRWTITNGDIASVADLCGEHSAPLNEVVAAAGLNPPEADTVQMPVTVPTQRQPRKASYEPLVWQPPAQ